MDSLPLIKGVGIGLAVATPVGPMSVLCMRRTLTKGWKRGFTTGLGIASGDGIYAFVAALGLVSVQNFMLAYGKPLHVLAGLFLLYLGLKTLFGRPAAKTRQEGHPNASDYTSALLLTLTNPPTILSFAAIFTILAPPAGFNAFTSAETVAGVFLGSALWWLVLTATVSIVRHAVGLRTRRWIEVLSGTALSLFGVAEIRRAL
jgi:threonine/homoserine/homoserine lactone efflux protein